MVKTPDLKRYSSYRAYLHDFYQFRKSQRSGFSFRLFSQRAGIKSPNYLQLVIQGKRNLSEELAIKVASSMGLKTFERDYFVALVRSESALTPEERAGAQKRILIAMRKIVTKQIPKAQAEILSRWYHLLVRELMLLEDFCADPEWISSRLRGLISSSEAEKSMKLLIQAGFAEMNAQGKYVVKDPVIDTGDSFSEARVLQFHCETLEVWKRALQEIPREDRELGILNLSIRNEMLPELKAKIRAFQDEILGWAEQQQNGSNRIVQLGTYIVPISI